MNVSPKSNGAATTPSSSTESCQETSESKNYIWSINKESGCICDGKNVKVYRGFNKETGDEVAVKTFKARDPPLHEIEMLKNLSHPNIIKLLDVDNELKSHKKVLMLELCNGGTLMDFLNLPENSYGLMDDEFMLVLKDLTYALRYMREQNVIHSEVKPENILRHLKYDGVATYKLAGLGSCRKYKVSENSSASDDTELQSGMDVAQVLAPPGDQYKKSLGPTIDLWEIGSTLYQTATGIKDIAAAQNKNWKELTFYQTLPSTTPLSFGLQGLITPIIASFFTQQGENPWTFALYYKHFLNLVSRRVIKVFYLNKLKMLKIYIKPEETFTDFKRYVYEQTKISEKRQCFLYKKSLVITLFRDFHTIDTDCDCVFLFDQKTTELVVETRMKLNGEDYANPVKKILDPYQGYENTNKFYKALCIYHNVLDYQSMVVRSVDAFKTNFTNFFKETIKHCRSLCKYLLEHYVEYMRSFNILEAQGINSSSKVSLTQFQTVTNNFVNEIEQLFKTLEAAKLDFKLHTVHNRYTETFVKEVLNLKHLINDLSIFCNDQTAYRYKKMQIAKSAEKNLRLITEVIHPDFENYLVESEAWYKVLSSHLRVLLKLRYQISSYKQSSVNLRKKIGNPAADILNIENARLKDRQQLSKILNDYRRTTANAVSLINENAECVEALDQILPDMNKILREALEFAKDKVFVGPSSSKSRK